MCCHAWFAASVVCSCALALSSLQDSSWMRRGSPTTCARATGRHWCSSAGTASSSRRVRAHDPATRAKSPEMEPASLSEDGLGAFCFQCGVGRANTATTRATHACRSAPFRSRASARAARPRLADCPRARPPPTRRIHFWVHLWESSRAAWGGNPARSLKLRVPSTWIRTNIAALGTAASRRTSSGVDPAEPGPVGSGS